MTRFKLLALVGVALALTTLTGVSSARASALSPHAYSIGKVYYTGGSWNAARATIEVHAGSLSAADADAGRFIAETLWVARDPDGVGWVELGYTRGWQGGNLRTPYWAVVTLTGQYYEHRVTNVPLTTEECPSFLIKRITGNNRWAFYIDGTEARRDDGVYYYDNCVGGSFNAIDVGLESSCTSGRLGISYDPINVTGIKKSSDGGSTWSFGPPLDYLIQDSGTPPPDTFGGWITLGQSARNHRNDAP